MEKGQGDAYIGYDGKSTADIAYPTMFNDPERFARDSPFLARLFWDFSHTDEFTRALRMCDYESIYPCFVARNLKFYGITRY